MTRIPIPIYSSLKIVALTLEEAPSPFRTYKTFFVLPATFYYTTYPENITIR